MKTVFFVFFVSLSFDLMAQVKKPAAKPAVKPAIVYDCPTMQKKYDSMRLALKTANFHINRIKVYLAICEKHPSYNQFLNGWIKRALQ